MEDKLWRIFENVNNWLEYAEQKNTLILTFIGIQLTLLKLFSKGLDSWLVASLIFLGMCFLVALISFFPQTVIPWRLYFWAKTSDKPKENDNLLFYGDIAKYSQKEYIEVIGKYFGEDIRGHKNLEDLCGQIVVNSQIASTKFNFFKATTWLMIIGQILLLFSLVGSVQMKIQLRDVDLIFRGIVNIILLALVYYFYKTWPVDTELGRSFNKVLFNFKVKPENPLEIVLPALSMIIITNLIIAGLSNRLSTTNLLNPMLFFVIGILLQPLFEEVAFRGFLLGAILVYAEKFKTSIWDSIAKYFLILFGLIFSGYLFAGWHYIEWDLVYSGVSIISGNFLSKPGGLIRVIQGILYGLFFWLSGRNLSSSYTAHATNNFIVFLFEYYVV